MRQRDGKTRINRCNNSPGLPLSSSWSSSRSSSLSRNKTKKVALNEELPWDLLDIICKKLNLDDLFEFAGVCQSWRLFHKSYWKTFMESHSPFIVQKESFAKKSLSVISLPAREIDSLKMDNFSGLSYSGCSSGYMIFAGPKFLLLMNPFTRKEKKVSTFALDINSEYKAYHALLAFVKGSEEFVIVFYSLIYHSLHVYKSRKSYWITYSNWGIPWKVVDLVVFDNSIYAIPNKAKIGVLNLNSVNMKILELGYTPTKNCDNLKLVKCDGQLLMVHFEPGKILDVYKINFSNMEYVRLDTLDDLALFHSSSTSCYVLRKPTMWGYKSNHVYLIRDSNPKCEVYSSSNNLRTFYEPHPEVQVPNRSKLYWVDWCFRHLHDEVDYS